MPSELEARVMRRISFRIVPFIMLLYFISFVDRVNIGFAALTMNKDLGFSSSVFGLGAGIFFLGYFLFEVPSNLILNKVGARLWIARVMITWGIISALFAFIKGETSFLTLRFLLGVAEAGFFPGIILYLSFWFPARYRAGVVSLFMAAAPISVVLGSPLSSALLELDGLLGLKGWQWMFILEAVPAFLLGFVVLIYLTDKPEKATWLKDDEREWLVNEMNAEHQAKAATASHSIWRGLADLRVLALSLIYFGTSAGLYTLGIWAPQIIKGFGLSTLAVGFLNAVPPTIAIIAMILWAPPFRQDQRADLARRYRLHHRGRGACARRISRVLGVCGCCTNARQYWHQFSEAAALGDADYVLVRICRRRWHCDNQLYRQPRWLCGAHNHRLDQRYNWQLPGWALLCVRLARNVCGSHLGSVALAAHSIINLGSAPP
jgi:MFS family permease